MKKSRKKLRINFSLYLLSNKYPTIFAGRNVQLCMKYMSKVKEAVLVIFLVMFALSAFAQTGSVRGRIIDAKTKKPLEFVNVSIRIAGSKTPLTGTVSDSTGIFRINRVKNGSYILTASFIGYRPVEKEFTISAKERNVNVKNLLLEEDSQVIDEIQVVGQRAQMRFEIDKKVFDVESNIAQAGGSASEILENIPSVEVDNEGEISLRGNSSVTIWINGKASGLSADNQAQILEQIPAESIERIEIITNPSARFRPEGTSGIINIILKKDRKAGYYGSLQVGADVLGGYNASASINYSSGKIESYLNVGYRQRKSEGEDYTDRINLDDKGNPVSFLNQRGKNDRKGGSLFTRAGFTLHLTATDHFSVEGFGHFGDRKSNNEIRYKSDVPGSFITSERFSHSDNSSKGGNINLDYKHEFSETSNIVARASWDLWVSDGSSIYKQHSLFANDRETSSWQKQKDDNRSQSWEFQVDYVNQFSKESKLEAGYKGSLGYQKSPVETYSGPTEASATFDELLYNKYTYDRNIQALYATYSTKINNFGVQLGLRGEYTNTETKSLAYGENPDNAIPYKDDYFSLFPSLFLSYSLPGNNEVQVNYTRRISRPRGWQLNPFLNMTDSLNISFGNPYLTPEFSNSFELNYIKNWEKHTLSLSTYYRNTDDVIQRIRYREGDVMKSTSANITQSSSVGAEIVAKNKLLKFLDVTTTLNFYYNELEGFSYQPKGADVPVTGERDDNFSWTGKLIANVMLPYAISFQATGNYNSRQIIAQGHRESSYRIDLGARKSFFNRKVNFSVSVQDILNSRSWHNVTSGNGFRQDSDSWRKGRMARFTLSYNFGNMKASKQKPQRSSEEMNMMEEEF